MNTELDELSDLATVINELVGRGGDHSTGLEKFANAWPRPRRSVADLLGSDQPTVNKVHWALARYLFLMEDVIDKNSDFEDPADIPYELACLAETIVPILNIYGASVRNLMTMAGLGPQTPPPFHTAN